MNLKNLQEELLANAQTDQIEEKFKYFHKTNVGGYAENDVFLGITIPNIRKIVKNYYEKLELQEVEKLLHSKYHEYRLAALVILTLKIRKVASPHVQIASQSYESRKLNLVASEKSDDFSYAIKKADVIEKEKIVKLYLDNTKYINGWDLVDISAHYVLGSYLLENLDKIEILYKLANSNNLWEKRISIISTWIFIRNGRYIDTLNIAKILLHDEHDLIHKAVGWMLREVGKKDFDIEYKFLLENYTQMPRTMLRYSIEKFEEDLRQKFLKGSVV